MNFIYRFLILRLVAWASQLTRADFESIIAKVSYAGRRFGQSEDKRSFVATFIKTNWPHLSGSAGNLLIELALAALKGGVVKLPSS